jgi:hypothetical protein
MAPRALSLAGGTPEYLTVIPGADGRPSSPESGMPDLVAALLEQMLQPDVPFELLQADRLEPPIIGASCAGLPGEMKQS